MIIKFNTLQKTKLLLFLLISKDYVLYLLQYLTDLKLFIKHGNYSIIRNRNEIKKNSKHLDN